MTVNYFRFVFTCVIQFIIMKFTLLNFCVRECNGFCSSAGLFVSSKMPSKDNKSVITNGGLNGFNNDTKDNDVNVTKWCPLHSTNVNTFPVGRYAVIILNQPVLIPPKLMINLWNNAKVRMTVDGGTTRWYKFIDDIKKNSSEINSIHPDIVSGDFDSISKPVLDIVKRNGCEIIRTPDQNYTDFRKALQILSDKNFEIDTVIAIVETSGRLDHLLANLNTLYSVNSIFAERHVVLYSLASNSLTWLLNPGKHSISIPQRLRDASTWCSLLPVGGPTVVTTSGLCYNMYNRKLEFGALVSSSNTYSDEEEVTIETNGYVIWSMGLGPFHH